MKLEIFPRELIGSAIFPFSIIKNRSWNRMPMMEDERLKK